MCDSIPRSRTPAARQIRQDFETVTRGLCYGAAFKMAAMGDDEMALLLRRLANKVRKHTGDLIHEPAQLPESWAEPPIHVPPTGPYLEVYVDHTYGDLPYFVDGPDDSSGIRFATPEEAGEYVGLTLKTLLSDVR